MPLPRAFASPTGQAARCESLEPRRLFAAAGHQELHRPPRVMADVNGDGADDLIVGQLSTVKGVAKVGLGVAGFSVYLNDGKGQFRFHGHTDCDDADSVVDLDIEVGQLGGKTVDGSTNQWPTLALKLYSVTGQPTPVGDVAGKVKLVLFSGNGKGDFQQGKTHVMPHVLEARKNKDYATDPYVETTIRGLDIGDMDGDGDGDLLSWEQNDVVAALTDGTDVTGEIVLPEGRSRDDGIIGLADFDGDGTADRGVVIDDALWYLHQKFVDGKPGPTRATKIDGFTIKQGMAVRLADVDGDGDRDDLVVIDGQQLGFGINEQGVRLHSFTWTQADRPLRGSTRDLLIGDADGDGADDLVTVKVYHDMAKSIIQNIRA